MILREVPIEISADDQQLIRSHRSLRRNVAPKYAVPVSQRKSERSFAEESNLLMTYDVVLSSVMPSELTTLLDELRSESNFLPTVQDECAKVSESKSGDIFQKDNILPSNDQNIVRYLINKQKFDDLWDLTDEIMEKISRKPFIEFQLGNNDVDDQILFSIVVILILETRFSSLSSLWYGIVQKARDRIIDLLGKDSNKIDKLFNDVRNQL